MCAEARSGGLLPRQAKTGQDPKTMMHAETWGVVLSVLAELKE
jgi:hypothetical protein